MSNSNSTSYPFDADPIIVSFNARPGSDTPVIISHKFRKPTLMELVARDREVNLEIVEISTREEQIVNDDESANARLWDKLIVGVKGYSGNSEWREVSDLEKPNPFIRPFGISFDKYDWCISFGRFNHVL